MMIVHVYLHASIFISPRDVNGLLLTFTVAEGNLEFSKHVLSEAIWQGLGSTTTVAVKAAAVLSHCWMDVKGIASRQGAGQCLYSHCSPRPARRRSGVVLPLGAKSNKNWEKFHYLGCVSPGAWDHTVGVRASQLEGMGPKRFMLCEWICTLVWFVNRIKGYWKSHGITKKKKSRSRLVCTPKCVAWCLLTLTAYLLFETSSYPGKRGLQLPWDLLMNSPLMLCR